MDTDQIPTVATEFLRGHGPGTCIYLPLKPRVIHLLSVATLSDGISADEDGGGGGGGARDVLGGAGGAISSNGSREGSDGNSSSSSSSSSNGSINSAPGRGITGEFDPATLLFLRRLRRIIISAESPLDPAGNSFIVEDLMESCIEEEEEDADGEEKEKDGKRYLLSKVLRERRGETDDGHITVPSGSERDAKASKNVDDTHRLATSAASFAASSVATSDGHNGDGVDANGDELAFPQRCLRVWSRSETVTVRRRRVISSPKCVNRLFGVTSSPSVQPAAEQGTTTTTTSTVTSGAARRNTIVGGGHGGLRGNVDEWGSEQGDLEQDLQSTANTASTDEDASVGAGEGKGTSRDTGKVVLRRRFRVHRFDVIVPLDVLLDRAEDDGTEEHELDFGQLATGGGVDAGVGAGLGGGGGSEEKADGCVNQTTTLIQLAFPLYKQARRGVDKGDEEGVERDKGEDGEDGEDGEGGEAESGGGVRSEYVFAHLPVCRSGLPFLVCADWELVSSREQIHGDASWNLWLRDQVSVRVKSTE
jgi:hypothetical protein